MAIGDAAGLVTPTTGGGIYYGLVGGDTAARTIDVLGRDVDALVGVAGLHVQLLGQGLLAERLGAVAVERQVEQGLGQRDRPGGRR